MPSSWGIDRMPEGWSAIRTHVMEQEPFCRLCGDPSQTVDHIRPRAEGGSEERWNLQALCSPCHRRKSAVEGGRGLQRAARRRRDEKSLSDGW